MDLVCIIRESINNYLTISVDLDLSYLKQNRRKYRTLKSIRVDFPSIDIKRIKVGNSYTPNEFIYDADFIRLRDKEILYTMAFIKQFNSFVFYISGDLYIYLKDSIDGDYMKTYMFRNFNILNE